MTRRWLGSADVEIDPATGALLVKGDFGGDSMAPPTSLVGGTKTVASATVAEPLVAVSTPCRCVWVAPLCNADGAGTNTKPVFLGDIANQNMPLAPGSISGVVLSIDDANKIFVKVGVNGEGVAYRIFA
jgi:hypothetical protein